MADVYHENRPWLFDDDISLAEQQLGSTEQEELTRRIPAMTEEDKWYDKRIRVLNPIDSLPTYEDDVRLADVIHQGKKADIDLSNISYLNLTNEEIQQLKDRSKAGAKAFETFVLSHLRLVPWFVRQTMDFNKQQRQAQGEPGHRGHYVRHWKDLAGSELNYGDRIQVATDGLIKAADTYTGHTKNGNRTRFSTWATVHMEGCLIREMDKTGPLKAEDTRKLSKAQQILAEEGITNPSYQELAQTLDETVYRVVEVSQWQNRLQPISWEVLQEFVTNKIAETTTLPTTNDESGLEDILVDEGSRITTSDEVSEAGVFDFIGDRISEILTEKEQLIIELRYGLGPHEPMKYNQIGEIVGHIGATVRKKEAIALAKLRGAYYIESDRDWQENIYDLYEEDPQHGLRAIVRLGEEDNASLGITNPAPIADYTGHYPLDSGRRKSYSLEEFQKMEPDKDTD